MHVQAFLALAFVVEGLLLGFHLKGTPLDVRVHLLLVLLVAAGAAAVLAEAARPASVLRACARSYAVLLQGLWWCQAGRILFLRNPAWAYSEDYLGGVMFLPVAFVAHLLAAALGLLLVYVLVAYNMAGRALGQRGIEAIERANDGQAQPQRLALHDLSGKGERAGLLRSSLYTQ